MKGYYKLQMKNDSTKVNHVDEVIADNRITSHIDYAGPGFENLSKGDIVLVHKGSYPHSLVEVLYKISDENEISGASFGIDYRVDVKSLFSELDNTLDFKKQNKQIGYDGTFNPLHDNTSKTFLFIKSWYDYIEKRNYISELKKIIFYKKQIILQGPPGTGKTRLAKQVADNIINNNPQNLSPKELIENFFKSGRSDEKYNENFKSRLEEFYEYFPKNQFSKMDIDDYCIGRNNSTNFCWWIERGLDKYGKFTPGNSGNYLIYYSKEDEDYRLTKFPGKSISDILPLIKDALNKLSENEDIVQVSKLFGDSFIIKILNSYYPEKYFPINGRTSLVNLMKIFDKPFKKIATIELNKSVQNIFDEYKNKYPSDITTLDFMHFLYSRFDLKNDGNLYEDSKKVDVSRKPTLIQFHPSYTYEDFVKGIVAKPNEKGGVIYKAENRMLAKLANDAIDYPDNNYVLIIDEINRANLSSVLGELIYALEYRGEEVESMYEVDGSQKLILPPNLFIIGTMNTADRSVGHIDYAIRRRFAFVDILPKNLTTELGTDFKKDIFTKVSELFIENYNPEIEYGHEESRLNRSQYLSEEFEPKDVWLGHSYFIQHYEHDANGIKDVNQPVDFTLRLEYEIKPILREYVKDGILKPGALEIIENLGK
ncbi:AAA family ATPase [Chryseobacterium sp. sg2396]|uniref:AAA family ATPase n=1 Tax=Chryseobacterium sp. sg2396 TaxID=3276280 RepID=UPI003670013A